jgi:lipopolysaccharide export system permease protein
VKTLHRYLLRQIIATLLMTVAVFTFVLLLGNALREVLPLLMSQKASFGRVAQAFGLLVPFVGVFALPMGLLTATLLVFGRFSADQEYTAARASGVSLISLATPILVLSLLLCVVSAAFNLDLGPRSRVAFLQLRFNLLANLTTIQLPEGRPVSFDGGSESGVSYTVSVGKNRRQVLEDIRVFQVTGETNLELVANAPRGKIELDPTNRVVFLRLYDAQVIYVKSGIPFSGNFSVELDLDKVKEKKASITDMTFSELRSEMAALERRLGVPLTNNVPTTAEASANKQTVKKQVSDATQAYRVQMHRRVAFSFACFGFALIGIPLGIRVHRRETNIGIGIALLLVGLYYGLLIAAEALTNRPEFAPHLLVWMPNFLFQAVGAVLLWRANRGI